MGGVGRVVFVMLVLVPLAAAGHDYAQALSKSILFFEAQRSGYLPRNQRVNWRADSGLLDGKSNGVDLVGGYYDAGDNVKFGLPMAFTITMMSWSISEYGKQMAASGELSHAMEAVKWGTDYLIKAHPEPNVLYGEVGDGNTDHYCWQRPEDMTTSRQAYRIDVNHPGSDLAGETTSKRVLPPYFITSFIDNTTTLYYFMFAAPLFLIFKVAYPHPTLSNLPTLLPQRWSRVEASNVYYLTFDAPPASALEMA